MNTFVKHILCVQQKTVYLQIIYIYEKPQK